MEFMMKSQKGVTLVALVIYIIVFTIVISILSVISSFFFSNVNFVKVVDDENIIVKTWERGAGATYSCGTGCSASVVVSNKLNLTKKKVNVKVPGGDLRIEIEGNSIYMIGDASFICDGRAY